MHEFCEGSGRKRLIFVFSCLVSVYCAQSSVFLCFSLILKSVIWHSSYRNHCESRNLAQNTVHTLFHCAKQDEFFHVPRFPFLAIFNKVKWRFGENWAVFSLKTWNCILPKYKQVWKYNKRCPIKDGTWHPSGYSIYW